MTDAIVLPPALRAVVLAGAAGMALALFTLGGRPEAVGLVAPPWDKLLHAAYFAALAALLWVGSSGRSALLVLAICLAVGVADELYQDRLPGRVASLADLLADGLAAAGTLALLRWAGRPRPPNRIH